MILKSKSNEFEFKSSLGFYTANLALKCVSNTTVYSNHFDQMKIKIKPSLYVIYTIGIILVLFTPFVLKTFLKLLKVPKFEFKPY